MTGTPQQNPTQSDGQPNLLNLSDSAFGKIQQEIEGNTKPADWRSLDAQSIFDCDDDFTIESHLSDLGIPGLTAKRVIDRGGMGVVLEAIQRTETFERVVAVKLIRPDKLNEQMLQRFRREQQLLANIQHKHVARLYESGIASASDGPQSGVPYFVMEYVKGQQLSEYCRTEKPDIWSRIRIMIDICKAVQHLHEHGHGIVHRDLSPGNILITGDRGSAEPKIIDLGLAISNLDGDFRSKKPEVQAQELGSRALAGTTGTLPYISPEQTGYESDSSVTAKSDIYALGTIMFELITGKPPYFDLMHKDSGETLREIAVGEQVRLSQADICKEHCQILGISRFSLKREINRDLGWIVDRTRRRRSHERYASVAGLVEDLQAYLDQDCISLRRSSRRYRLNRFLRKYRSGVAATAVVFFTLLAGLSTSLFMLNRATTAERDGNKARGRAVLAAKHEKAAREEAEAALRSSETRRANLELAGELLRDVFSEVGKDIPRVDSESASLAEGEILRQQLVSGSKKAVARLNKADKHNDADFDYIRFGLAAALRLSSKPGDADLLIVSSEKSIQDRIAIPQVRMLQRLILASVATADQRFEDAGRNVIAARQEIAQSIGETQAVQSTSKWIAHIQANLRTAQGDYEEALRIREEHHSAQVPTLPMERNFYFANLQNIGVLRFQLKRYDKAIDALENVVDVYARERPSDDMAVLTARSNLAMAYHKSGFDDAYVHLKRSIYLTQLRTMGAYARPVGIAKMDLAIALANTDQDDEALSLFNEIISQFSEGDVGLQAQLERSRLLKKLGRPLNDEDQEVLNRTVKEKLPNANAEIEHPGIRPMDPQR